MTDYHVTLTQTRLPKTSISHHRRNANWRGLNLRTFNHLRRSLCIPTQPCLAIPRNSALTLRPLQIVEDERIGLPLLLPSTGNVRPRSLSDKPLGENPTALHLARPQSPLAVSLSPASIPSLVSGPHVVRIVGPHQRSDRLRRIEVSRSRSCARSQARGCDRQDRRSFASARGRARPC